MTHPMSEPWLGEDDLAALQETVEYLRLAPPHEFEVMDRTRAGLLIATKLEQIVTRLTAVM